MMVDPPAAIGLEALAQAVGKLMTMQLVMLRILPLKALLVLVEKPEMPDELEGREFLLQYKEINARQEQPLENQFTTKSWITKYFSLSIFQYKHTHNV
jgi:hypothetical protein